MRKSNLLLSLVMTLFLLNVNAQIVYTDITDGIPTGIDFNSDGTMEFDVSSQGNYIEYSNYGADNNIHAVGTMATQDWDVPDCVAAGFVIDASNQWEGAGDCSIDAWGAGNSTITPNQDEYLAVRFNLGGTDIYYGWIRFSMDNSGNLTYKDYAYNSTANSAINAGDTGTTTTVLVNSITVQGQGGISTITTSGGTLQMEANVLPANATNNTVSWSVANGTGSATINSSGLLSAIADGTVTVTATANDASGIDGSFVITISNQSVGISKVSENSFSIFPNPSSEFVIITNNTRIIIEHISIYSIDGMTVFNGSLNNENNKIDIHNLLPGLYIISLTDNNGDVYKEKFVKK
jgi:hypothetical protein